MTGLMWFTIGWTVGVLTLMQAEVLADWRARRHRSRHPSQYQLRRPNPGRSNLDEWDGL